MILKILLNINLVFVFVFLAVDFSAFSFYFNLPSYLFIFVTFYCYVYTYLNRNFYPIKRKMCNKKILGIRYINQSSSFQRFENLLFLGKFKPSKFKSHPHQIIPKYIPKQLNFNSEKGSPFLILFKKFLLFVDKHISYLPPYFLIVISIGALFMLFFVFLHKKVFLVSFIPSDSVFGFEPQFPKYFFGYYSSLIFYILLLWHSIYKFFLHLFDEVRSVHIYTEKVEAQYMLGISLFILSEAMLFLSFFWAFLHSSLSPSIYIGNCWPPIGVDTLNPWHIPFLNTLILLISGTTVNWFFFTLQRLTYWTYYSPSYKKLKAFKFSGKTQNITICYTDFPSYTFMLYSIFNFYFVPEQYLEFHTLRQRFKSIFLAIDVYNFGLFYIYSLIYLSSYSIFYKLSWFFSRFFLLLSYFNEYLFKKFMFFSYFELTFIRFWFHYYYYYYFLLYSFFNIFYDIFKNNMFIVKYINFVNSFLDINYFSKLYIRRSLYNVFLSLFVTIYLGFMFLGFQYIEYKYYANFDLTNIYGTVFYMLTSLHGLHVYVGLFSLITCYAYFRSFEFNKTDITRRTFVNVIIVFSVWYWHFVDVVWILLFVIVYLWGS